LSEIETAPHARSTSNTGGDEIRLFDIVKSTRWAEPRNERGMSMAEPKPEQSLATPPADPMTDLIKRINEAHNEVRLSLKRTGECAIKAGLLLIEAKKLVRHGSFAEWIAANCALSERTAQLYMQVARKFPNPQKLAEFSLSDLMEMLGPAKLPTIKDVVTTKKDDLLTVLIKKKGAFEILERVWQAISEHDRDYFKRRITMEKPASSA
jgi:hypothetical protein